MKEYVDPPIEDIEAKLQEVEDFEARYKPTDLTRSWRKWCSSYEYRKNEWLFRQGLVNFIKNNETNVC